MPLTKQSRVTKQKKFVLDLGMPRNRRFGKNHFILYNKK